MRTFGTIVTAAVVAGVAASGACGDSGAVGTGGGDCSSNPFQCAANQTCWPNEDISSFLCFEAPADKNVGDACNFVGGQITCPAGTVCIVQGPGEGVCSPYCDGDHDCPDLAACVMYSI